MSKVRTDPKTAPYTSLERAYALPRVRPTVATLLLVFTRPRFIKDRAESVLVVTKPPAVQFGE